MAAIESDFGAFVMKLLLQPPVTDSPQQLPLNGLTFAVKDIYDVEGYVTGFGNPDWARTHPPAISTAPSVLALLNAGATCVGKTVMDEMAYCLYGENKHYGTPVNPCAPDRIPGGSSSGSAVAVAAKLVDFSLGTDTGASVRVPAAFCGIYGFRPSHATVPISGVIPMSQSFDTVGWFARDPVILNQVGRVLLQLTNMEPVQPSFLIIPDDCFQLLGIPSERVTQVLIESFKKLFGDQVVRHTNLGDYVKDKVPTLKHFMTEENDQTEYNIPSLMALSSALRMLQRCEFKNNHGEWINSVKPDLGPGISERIQDALQTTSENIDVCNAARNEFRTALTDLLEEYGILAIPTFPGPPFKLQTDTVTLEHFHARAFSLLSVAGFSGFCQVSIPLGTYDNLPVAVSLLAKHGADGFLLNLVEALDGSLKEQIDIAQNLLNLSLCTIIR
ncbi:amidase 1-like isoform X2 [Macadamia integrifolia]|uniref:amidase 1-like isoform X2 n=1 Tax=Macadamia integrifolia TaxID=60698 RepID=UPI001C4FD0CA|nr:amidase 1-like isoform X2 [Macadamia integrifolia]